MEITCDREVSEREVRDSGDGRSIAIVSKSVSYLHQWSFLGHVVDFG